MLTLNRPLAIIDLEATGTDPESARIIQVALNRIAPRGEETDRDGRFSAVVNPGVPVDDHILSLTGITQEEIDAAEPWFEVAKRLERYLLGADLAGYNILRYDFPLLESEFSRLNCDVPGPDDRKIVDALQLEKRLRPRTLEAVYERRTGQTLEDAHDAGADVAATKSVLLSQGEEMAGRVSEDAHGPFSPAELEDYALGDYLDAGQKLKERSDGAIELCFGKHAGKTLQEVHDTDRDYLAWMYREITELQPHIENAFD